MATRETRKSASPQLSEVLAEVGRRIRHRNAIGAASVGLAIGCFAAMLSAGLIVAGIDVAWPILPLSMAVGAGAGALIGLLLPSHAEDAAAAIDQHYAMKDRAITALQFQHDQDDVRKLQVIEAREHLAQVKPEECVEIHANRPVLWSSVAMAALAVGVVLFASPAQKEAQAVQPIRLATQQADELRQTMIEEIEELADEVEEPELQELVEELNELVEELEANSIDERDMMATLSEMESAISAVHDAMQLQMADAQMMAIADAMQSAESMKAAAAAMKNGDYDQASDELKQVDPNQLGDKERRAVADNLKKFLAELSPGNQGQISGAASQMQEGLANKSATKFKEGVFRLSRLCDKQSNRKKIGECMACQLNRLSQCKGQCRGSSNTWTKSKSSSSNIGKAATGSPNDGDPTKLNSTRQQEQLTGAQGDGDSESELIESNDGRQQAAREYVQRYQKFRSEAEAVLDSEPLPLGHRETVRKYFENIRPSNAEAAAIDSP